MMKIEDFYIGQEASLTKIFTTEDVENFARLSKDCNPIHLDLAYANGLYKNKIMIFFNHLKIW